MLKAVVMALTAVVRENPYYNIASIYPHPPLVTLSAVP